METLHKNIFKQPFFWTSICSLLVVGIIIGLYSYAWVAPTASPNSNAGAAINFSGGKVGIGTVSPQTPLSIYTPTESSAVPVLRIESGTGATVDSGGAIEFYKPYDSPMGRIYTLNQFTNGAGSQGKLILSSYYNSYKDEMTLWNGNVGIGTVSPSSKLDIVGNVGIRAGNGLRLYNPANTDYATISLDGVNVVQAGYPWNFSGTVTSSAFYYSSDATLKKDIQEIETPLAKIMKLKGISFSWKETDKPSIGLIAQDVEKVFPEIVQTDNQTGLKSVEYGNLVAPLIEAMKEQQKMIDVQRELINQQGEEIKSLKTWLGQS